MGKPPKLTRRFQFLDYSLHVKVVDHHLVVKSPDFDFPIPVVRPFDPPSIETAGKALMAAWIQIQDYLREMDKREEDHPLPRKSPPYLKDEISLGEACKISGLKPTMLRELADSGEIPCRYTPKGHRRFPRKPLEVYSEKIRENLQIVR